MKNKMILIAATMIMAPTVFAKTLGLNCIVGSSEKLQMASVVVSDSQAAKGLGNITLSNLDKAQGWVTFERAETKVEIHYTIDTDTQEKNIIGATVDMGKSGLISINTIAVMNDSIYAELTANALGFNYAQGINALCVNAEKH